VSPSPIFKKELIRNLILSGDGEKVSSGITNRKKLLLASRRCRDWTEGLWRSAEPRGFHVGSYRSQEIELMGTISSVSWRRTAR